MSLSLSVVSGYAVYAAPRCQQAYSQMQSTIWERLHHSHRARQPMPASTCGLRRDGLRRDDTLPTV